MKVIAIGDIHGRKVWEKIVERPADKYVFVGDYFDTHGTETAHQQLVNFGYILAFKKKNPEAVTLLIGNHDFHYLSEAGFDRYSGFQDHHQEMIRELLEQALDGSYLQMCALFDDVLYSHAGVTKTWFKKVIPVNEEVEVSSYINKLWHLKPEMFRFAKEARNPYGDDMCQGPLWVRPASLEQDAIEGVKQVVGHTQMERLTFATGLAFIDTLGTSAEFLEVVDGVFKIKEL